MPIEFGVGEALKLLQYGKFTLLSIHGEIAAKDAVTIDKTPFTAVAPAVDAVYDIRDDWYVLTERFNFGDTSRPNKVYYELWNDPGELELPEWNVGFYCGSKIRESNIDNVCLPPGTLIMGNDSLKPIASFRVGERVLTHTGRYSPVTRTYVRPYSGELTRIRPFHSPEVRLTPNHKVYAIKTKRCSVSRSQVCMQNCMNRAHLDGYFKRPSRPNEKPVGCKKFYEYYRPEWIPVGELTKDDIILLSFPIKELDLDFINVSDYLEEVLVEDGMVYSAEKRYGRLVRNPNANQLSNKLQLTSEFMRLIGYYLSEGSVGSDTQIVFSFRESEDTFIEDVASIVGRLGLSIKMRRRCRVKDVYFSCKPLALLFKRLFGSKSDEKHLPHFMLNLPRDKLYELVKGVFRGDGSVSYNSSGTRLEFTTVSLQLAHQIRLILLKLGFVPTFREQRGRTTTIEGREVKGSKIYGVYLDGYPELCEDIFGKTSKTNRKNRKLSYIKDGYLHSRIREIKREPYNGLVYNLETDDHSYNTLAVTCKNCTHIFSGGKIHVKLWNCSSPAQDVIYDFTVWYFTYHRKFYDKVLEILLKTPSTLQRIEALLKLRALVEGPIKPEVRPKLTADIRAIAEELGLI